MKNTIGIFSLSVLLFSTLAPSFTYATGEVVDNNDLSINSIGEIYGNSGDNDKEIVQEEDVQEEDVQEEDVQEEDVQEEDVQEEDVQEEDVQEEDDLHDSLFDSIGSESNNIELFGNESNEQYLNRCYEYEMGSYGYLFLNKYLCDETDVIIPTSLSGENYFTRIMNNAFEEREISSIVFPKVTKINQDAFSGATFNGNIVISGDVEWSQPYRFIVGENGVLTFKIPISQMYYVEVNGKLVYDIGDYNSVSEHPQTTLQYFLARSLINGEVEIRGLNGILDRGFYNSNITENGIITLGEGITKINDSFTKYFRYDDPSYTNGSIILPQSLVDISESFNETVIGKNIVFPKSLNNLYDSFRESSINSDFFFESNDEGSGFNITNSFGYSNIGSLVFSGLNISLNNVSPQIISGDLSFINSRFTSFNNFLTIGDHIISGDVNFINTDLNLNGGQFFRTSTIVGDFNFSGENYVTNTNGSTVPVGLKIGGDLNITGVNVLNPIFQNSVITGSVNINASTMNLQYSLNNSKIKGNMSIIGDDISAKYGALNNLSISGDFLMSGNVLDLESSVLNNLKIDGDFEIKGGLLKARYYVLNGLNVYGDLKLPKNSEFGAGTLGGVIAKGNYIISYDTTVSIGDSVNNAQLSNDVKIVADEIESSEINANDDKIVVQNSEIVATSGMVVEYEGGLKVNFQDNSSSDIEGTARFSAPIAVKVPVKNIANNYVKVMVKHQGDEDFGFTGLTLSQENVCYDGIPTSNQYNGEDVPVEENNGERYAVIYTCSASTFVAYTESIKPAEPKPSAGGGSVIKQEVKSIEQEHDSAGLEKENVLTDTNKSTTTRSNETVEQKVKKVEGKALTRGEVAVMTNILLEVFPQLIEGNQGLDDITRACSDYTDEKDFTKDEKKAITRLCKLSIMGIHNDNNEPLDEFLVKQKATNGEFATVMDRVVKNYNEKDLAIIKETLKKLENDEQSVVFGTVFDVFMFIKNIFN